MTLHVRFATGFRWRPRLHAEAPDFVRVLEDGGVHLALMANAFDGAFSTCWPAGSRMILDFFVQAWGETAGPLQDRLLSAFAQARARFEAQPSARLTQEEIFENDPARLGLAAATNLLTRPPLAHHRASRANVDTKLLFSLDSHRFDELSRSLL